MRSVGLDLGSRKISYCIIEQGRVVARGTVADLDELADRVGPGSRPASIAFEACREAWHVHATVTQWGQTPLLIDTTRVRRIGVGQHGRKTDRLDAEAIAWAVERGQIPLAHLLSPQRQQLRVELLTRRGLMETRSQMITTVRGMVRGQGLRITPCDAERFLDKVEAAMLPESVKTLVEPLLAVVRVAHAQLCTLDERIEALCAKEPAIRLLSTVPGVGLLVAAMFVSVIDQARRFRSARQVASYLGLVPLEKTSGLPGQRLGAITKHGNGYARALLVQAAWALLQHGPASDPLACWGRGPGSGQASQQASGRHRRRSTNRLHPVGALEARRRLRPRPRRRAQCRRTAAQRRRHRFAGAVAAAPGHQDQEAHRISPAPARCRHPQGGLHALTRSSYRQASARRALEP